MQLVTSDHAILAEVKAELHQCQVEIGTQPCANIADLRKDLTNLRKARHTSGSATWA